MRTASFLAKIGLGALVIIIAASGNATVRAQSGFTTIEGKDSPEHDYDQIYDTTVERCEFKCVEDAQCRGFTYNISKKVCFFKRELSGLVDFPGAVTVVRNQVSNVPSEARQQTPSQQPTKEPERPASPYVVDGLALGESVNLGSVSYRAYQCVSSDQFPGFSWCQRNNQERRGKEAIFTSNSILHRSDGKTAYINHYVRPAFLNEHEATTEIDRLSAKFGEKPRISHMPDRNGFPRAIIASWGKVEFVPVEDDVTSVLAAGTSRHAGLLLDFLGDFQKSAKLNLPVYRLTGGAGYVWNASFDQTGRGHLRFLAVDTSALIAPATAPTSSTKKDDPRPSTSPPSPTCSTSPPGPGYVYSDYRYVLTKQIYAAKADLEAVARAEYGADATIADWSDLRRILVTDRDIKNFASFVGIELQGGEYECANYFVKKNGASTFDGTNRYLLTRHGGVLPDDWLVLDELGGGYFHLGRWTHPSQILVRLPAREIASQDAPGGAPQSTSMPPPGKRIALVVGNSNYRDVGRLENPSNDAKLMAGILKRVGFELVGNGAQLDLDKATFDSAVQDFGNRLQGADVGVFYYAGHGLEIGGRNYLVPVSANPTREADVDFQMVDAEVILHQMELAGAKLNVVMLDACRNNPFGGRSLRAASGGLARMEAPEGTLISYASQPGKVAQDGSEGDSPYTKALAEMIPKPGLNVFQTFNEVGLVVKRATGGSQQPWMNSSPIEGDFYFAGK